MEETLIAFGVGSFLYLCYYKSIVMSRNKKRREELRKKIDKEMKEREKEFIYEYPELSISSIKNLTQQIIALKYKWIEYDKNIIDMINYDSVINFTHN